MNYKKELIRRAKIDYFLIAIVIISPFAFYLHLLSPSDSKIWQNKLFTIDAGYFEYVQYYLWIYSYKFLTIILISTWFISCKYWWKMILLVPFSFEIFKLASFINDRYEFISDFNIYHSLPLIAIGILILYVLNYKLKYSDHQKSDSINFEIYQLMREISSFDNREVRKLANDYKLLKSQKKLLKKREYLKKLIELSDSSAIVD